MSGTLEQALADAAHDAEADDGEPVILMSPACASFDQFRNFEDRGDRFRAMVAARPDFRPARKG
jgi:UDP-N-acetylmuramoylalanine--D-glutamate ligase